MAFGLDDAIAGVSGLLTTAIDKIWPDPADKAKAEAIAIQAAADAAVAQLKAAQEVMLAEANSQDPWTSRARPSFMYVMYVCILAALPMGVLFAFNPTTANQIAVGFGAWLSAIPSDMWTLFGVGYVGYSGSRTFEKIKGVSK